MADNLTKTRTNLDWVVAYKTIGDVVYSLKQLELGNVIEDNEQLEAFKQAVFRIWKLLGHKEEIDVGMSEDRKKILTALEGEDGSRAIGALEKEGGEDTEKEMASRSLSGPEIEALVAEYEAAVARGESGEEVAAEFRRVTGFNVEGFLSEEQKRYQESLKAMEGEGVAVEKLKDIAREITAEEVVLADELKSEGVKEAQVLTEKATEAAMTTVTAKYVDINKIRGNVSRILGKVEAGKRVELTEKIVETSARAKMKIEAYRLAKRVVKNPEDEGKMEDEILACWRGEREDLPVTVLGEATPAETRKINEKVRRVKTINREVFEIEELRVLRESIVMAVAKASGNEEVDKEMIVSYAKFAVEFYRHNPVRELRREAEEAGAEAGVSPGQFEEGFLRTQVLHHVLAMGRIEEKVAFFRKIVERIPNLNAADYIGPARVVNGMMRAMQVPDMVNNIMAVRRRIGGISGVIKAFRAGGIDNVVLDLSKRVGGQPIVAFARNAMALISKEGFSKGIGLAIKGLLSTGKVAAGVGAKAVAGAGAKVAAGTVGGPVGVAIAAVVSVVMPVLKKLGGLPGAVLGFVADIGEKAVLVGGLVMAGAFASAIALIELVIMFVFIGLFAYQMFQSSQISSLVGPVGLGRGVGAEYDSEAPALMPEKVTCEGGGGNSLREKVFPGVKQNEDPWAKVDLPGGCTLNDSGCGPVSVAKVLMKKNKDLTPEFLVYEKGSPYKNMGCDGSSLEDAKKSLEKHLGAGAVAYTQTTKSCNKKNIAKWICEGDVVMILANFYQDKELGLGGHHFLAVEVKDGEIYSDDPFYPDGAVLSGKKAYGQVQAIRECLVIDGDKIKYD